MADDDELRLNELHRFRKTSKRLALEAYGSCEVPAGCGGVVLRWRRPDAPIGISLTKYIAFKVDDFCLDGQTLEEQRVKVDPGAHVLSFMVNDLDYRGFVMLRLDLLPEIVTARTAAFGSRADGRCRAALTEPPDGWRLPGFDDSGFTALIEKPVAEPSGTAKWDWERVQRDAQGLGLPEPAGSPRKRLLSAFRAPQLERAWVRWSFWVDHEGFS